MPQENPLDQMMHEMKKLLQQLEENTDKIISQDVPFETEKKLDAWQKSVSALVSEIEATVKETGVPLQVIREVGEEIPPALTSDERETLKRMKNLRQEIEEQRKRYKAKLVELSLDENDEKGSPQSPPPSARKGSRKSKFKKLGGDNWKPV